MTYCHRRQSTKNRKLDLFRVSRKNVRRKNVPFQANVPFLYPPEKGNLWFSNIFRGYRNLATWNAWILHTINQFVPNGPFLYPLRKVALWTNGFLLHTVMILITVQLLSDTPSRKSDLSKSQYIKFSIVSVHPRRVSNYFNNQLYGMHERFFEII